MTKVKVELFTEPDQLMFVERGVRSGVATVVNRHSKVNNPYMASHDPTKHTKYILYLDANNLYDHSISQLLPVRAFKFFNPE